MLHRIQRRETFRRLRNPAENSRQGCIGVKRVDSRAGEASPAFGFAIPRHFGSAVARNRVRRQLRHLLVDLDASEPVRSGQYLITVRPARSGRPVPDREKLRQDLHAAMTRLGALGGADGATPADADAPAKVQVGAS